MKKTLIALLAVAFVSTALADKRDDDYWQFEKWLQYVHQEAPRYGLKLHFGDAAEAEWFYLYYWQSKNYSIERALKETKALWGADARATANLWLCSYVCYVHGKADSIGCAVVEANSASEARRKFHKENFGETCRITNVEKAK